MTNKFFDILKTIFPVNKDEIPKFLPMTVMLSLIVFIYGVLRSTKDSILITNLGAEMISTVKLFGVLPGAILFFFLYSKIASLFDREKVFYIICAIFLGYVVSFDVLLYPLREHLTLDLSALKEQFYFARYPLTMIEHWVISIYYIMAELWGSVMLTLLFWQFANYITPVTQAKRFYSLFGLLGQCGQIMSGIVVKMLSDVTLDNLNPEARWQSTLDSITLSVGISMALLVMIYWWMNRYILTDKKYFDIEQANSKSPKKKLKLSIAESLKYIFTSRYLGLIAILVISYGISINLVEGIWKSAVKAQYPTPIEYSHFMGDFQIYTGIGTVIGMLIGVQILSRFSWYVSAVLTPLMILVTGAIFFAFYIYQDQLGAYIAYFGFTALMVAVLMGALQNILSKSIKYSLFDATKEMSYIPLEEEAKVKGKAAVDVVGGRLGKSGGAIVQWLLLTFTGLNLNQLSEEIFGIFIFIMIVWIYGVYLLSHEFEKEKSKSGL